MQQVLRSSGCTIVVECTADGREYESNQPSVGFFVFTNFSVGFPRKDFFHCAELMFSLIKICLCIDWVKSRNSKQKAFVSIMKIQKRYLQQLL